MSAADFRRSIEASLPPLTQYSVNTGAPGVYGAYGWGSMFGQHAAAAATGMDSVRASRTSVGALSGSQDHSVNLSASLRHSFSRWPPQQPQRNSSDGHGTQSASERYPPVQHYPPLPPAQHEADVERQPFLRKPPTAPVAPPPGPGGDATVVVQAMAVPRLGLAGAQAARQASAGEGGRPDEDGAGAASTRSAAQAGQGATSNGGATVRFQEQVTYHHYQYHSSQSAQPAEPSGQSAQSRHQQPYVSQNNASPYGANGLGQGKVVHMRRTEAWTKYIAYEGCLQVCLRELEKGSSPDAHHFLAGAFGTLRRDFGIDGLLLTQVLAGADTFGADGGINDICWDDMEPPEKRLNTVAFASNSSASYMRIRCRRLSLPSASVLQKLCCRTRTHLSLPSFSGVVVHIGPDDDSSDPASFTLDGQGSAVQRGQAVVFPLDAQDQQGVPAPPPPQHLGIHVEGPGGQSIASGSLSYRELWRLAMQQRDPVDEAHAAGASGVTVDVQVSGLGEYQGRIALVSVGITRVRKELAGYELAHVAPDGGGVETVNKNSLRTNACLAYDTALGAALDANGCGRHKLLVEGAWEWLLGSFAAYFGVRTSYCTLAHLRWVVKPGVATISTMCLEVIAAEIRPLLEQSAQRSLSTHEATLLEGVKKAVEMLLEVAFENYYALGDDQPREAQPETPRGATAAPSAWQPTVLLASFRLFAIMKDLFLPTDQDWLNTRFRIAAKKRWHFLECNCGYDQMRELFRGRQQPPPKLGYNINVHDDTYKMAEKMGMAIRMDLAFDIFLQGVKGLLPSPLNLPRITAEEYMANFVEILRNLLHKCPPLVPSVPAVDLLVATASLQRYLQETQLYMPRQHPGHLDAMDLWKPHVLFWIDNSRRGLCGHCVKLEAEAKLSAAHLARVDVAKMPGMIEGIEGAVAPLVHDMLDRTWAELMLYERVVKNWPLFGPHLEAALCDVLRTVQGSLNRICAGANNQPLGALPPAPGGPMQHGGMGGMGPGGHRRVPSNPHAGPGPSPRMHPPGMGPPGAMHGRTGSHLPYGPPSPGMPGAGPMRSGLSVPMVPAYPGGGGGAAHGPMSAAGQAMPAGRNVVLLKEAVLLNSLKVLMVMVPSIEDIISKWCGGNSVAPPGPPGPPPPDAEYEYDDDLAPHIGAQFAQVVKELRTDYAEGVASCSNRMANHIRAVPTTNIKAMLTQPKPPAESHGGYQPVSTMTHQRDYVETFMRPILSACDEALQALRAALDPRVFVATGRALWDCMGKDLYEFVHFLQESSDNKGAWRLRQHANIALTLLCEFFRTRLAACMEHCIGDRDLDLPINVDKAQKLLAQNTAVVNITLNPI